MWVVDDVNHGIALVLVRLLMCEVLRFDAKINHIGVTVNNRFAYPMERLTGAPRDELQDSSWVVVARPRRLNPDSDAEGHLILVVEENLLHEAHLELDLEVLAQ